MWRDEKLHPDEKPTVFAVVVCAEDIVTEEHGIALSVSHVLGIGGRGFMPCVLTRGTSRNGSVHYGETDVAYASAEGEGRAMLRKRQSERGRHDDE